MLGPWPSTLTAAQGRGRCPRPCLPGLLSQSLPRRWIVPILQLRKWDLGAGLDFEPVQSHAGPPLAGGWVCDPGHCTALSVK